MKKKFEYNEPEFKLVISSSTDILTDSGETPQGSLGRVKYDWEGSMNDSMMII